MNGEANQKSLSIRKFMLSMAFGQSKYYVDSLSENTKQGLRQKVRLGMFPGQAPEGYMNDVRTKTIMVHKKNAKTVELCFSAPLALRKNTHQALQAFLGD